VTGIQIRGLQENINNPLLVFQTFKELYSRMYLPDQIISCVDLTLHFFRKHPKFFKMRRYLETIVNDFNFMMSFDSMTYDQVRNYLAHVSKDHDDYQVPNEQVVLQEIRRILSLVLNGTIYETLNKLRAFTSESIEAVGEIPSDLYSVHPVFLALRNSVSLLKEQSMELQKNNSFGDLSKTIELLTLCDPTLMGKGQRKSKIMLQNMTKMGRSFRSEMRFGVNEYVNLTMRDMQVKKAFYDLDHQFKRMLS